MSPILFQLILSKSEKWTKKGKKIDRIVKENKKEGKKKVDD
jgi:hypothetical protein